MKLVKHILAVKGYDVWSIAPDTPVFDALQLMAEKQVGALIVLEAGKVVGVISERDYARKVILKGKASKETVVKEIMTTPVIYTAPEESIKSCMALMTAKHIRHLPVMVEERLIGVISIGDLVKTIIRDQKGLIEQLESYIIQHTSIA
ncbi:MAG: CBS domain-containing protein [Chloroflexi bacterium]|nr:CBS domain-containing protein [Chloroflexota bacterium]